MSDLRYEKLDRMIELIRAMQSARLGLSLEDIQDRFDVGRRTAMRMRDTVLRTVPETIESRDLDGRTKRWRIPEGDLRGRIACRSEEVDTLRRLEEAAAQAARRGYDGKGLEAVSDILEELSAIRGETSCMRKAA